MTLEQILAKTTDPDWAQRAEAARQLATFADQASVVSRLSELLDDQDTAVTEVATKVLAENCGQAGLRIVLRAYTLGDDDVAYHIGDALMELQMTQDIQSQVTALLEDSDPAVQQGAREFLSELPK